MSLAALNWAFGLELKPAALKFLLVALADNTNHEGQCYPSLAALEHKTCLDRKTVIRGLDELERIGLLADTGERIGRTGRVKIYRLVGFDTGERHYTYRITDEDSGEFYIGVRTCEGDPAADVSYMGSGTWPLRALREKRRLRKEVLLQYQSRQEANSAEFAIIGKYASDPLCRNVLKGLCSAKSGIIPSAQHNSAAFPANGAVFPGKQSQKRNPEPLKDPKTESSGTDSATRAVRAQTAKRLPDGFELTPERQATARAEAVNPEREFARFCDHWRAASGASARKHDWDAAWRNWCRKANDLKPTLARGGASISPQQLEAEGLQKLQDRREAIGLASFRDPSAGETAAQYRLAQDTEYNRLQQEHERRKAVRGIAELTAAKRMST